MLGVGVRLLPLGALVGDALFDLLLGLFGPLAVLVRGARLRQLLLGAEALHAVVDGLHAVDVLAEHLFDGGAIARAFGDRLHQIRRARMAEVPLGVVVAEAALGGLVAQALLEVVHHRRGARVDLAVALARHVVPRVLADRIGRVHVEGAGGALEAEAAHRRVDADALQRGVRQVHVLVAGAHHAHVPILVQALVEHGSSNSFDARRP